MNIYNIIRQPRPLFLSRPLLSLFGVAREKWYFFFYLNPNIVLRFKSNSTDNTGGTILPPPTILEFSWCAQMLQVGHGTPVVRAGVDAALCRQSRALQDDGDGHPQSCLPDQDTPVGSVGSCTLELPRLEVCPLDVGLEVVFVPLSCATLVAAAMYQLRRTTAWGFSFRPCGWHGQTIEVGPGGSWLRCL